MKKSSERKQYAQTITKCSDIVTSLEEQCRTALFLKELCIALGEDKELHQAISNRDSTKAFNLLSNSCIESLIMCLMRIWDKKSNDKKRKSLPQLMHFFEDKEWLKDHFAEDAKNWPGNPESNYARISELISKSQKEYKKIQDSNSKDTLNSIKKYRDIYIAHTLNKKMTIPFKYKDLYDLATESAKIISNLYLCIRGIHVTMFKDEDSYEMIYKDSSKALAQDIVKGLT